MQKWIDFFSLNAPGEVPVGLREYKNEQKLNQPALQEQKQYSFQPLFKQNYNFQVVSSTGEHLSENDCGLKWFNHINNSTF